MMRVMYAARSHGADFSPMSYSFDASKNISPSLSAAKVTGASHDLFFTQESVFHNLSHQAWMSSTSLALTFTPSPVSHGSPRRQPLGSPNEGSSVPFWLSPMIPCSFLEPNLRIFFSLSDMGLFLPLRQVSDALTHTATLPLYFFFYPSAPFFQAIFSIFFFTASNKRQLISLPCGGEMISVI